MKIKRTIIAIGCFLAELFFVNVTGQNQYKQHVQLSVIPRPNQVTLLNGAFSLTKSNRMVLEMSDSIRKQLMAYMVEEKEKPLYHYLIQVSGKKKGKDNIRFVIRPALNLPTEGYHLRITQDSLLLEASQEAGLFYGIQTLTQLAMNAENGQVLPAVEIFDKPRFAYRGVMLDISRHFYGKDFLKKQIDLLAHYKINRLHLHLTDAAGWRIEIKRFPRLTSQAAWRTQAKWKDWWNGKRYYSTETCPDAYGGYLTKNDVRELVEYAQKRAVTIIPEIEMPSHSEEVLAAYPELSCTHQPYGPSNFCIGNEKTFQFLEQVLMEVMDLFPSEYIHIGGDEASKTAWKTCLLCQRRIREEGLNGVDGLQSYLVHRIERFLNAHGRKLLGWDEILDGGLAPNATVMSWRGTEGGLAAVSSGHAAIMTPGAYCYLDSYQDAPHTQPEAIGGYLPLKKVYGYDPVPPELNDDQRRLVLGVQANLWTEYIATEAHAEYMLYPRVLAVAETGWTEPSIKSWPDFHQRAVQEVSRIRRAGYHTFDLAREYGNRPEAAEVCQHKAFGKPVNYRAPFWSTYPAGGNKALTDGLRGGWSYLDGRWQGFVSDRRLDVVVDLEQLDTIHAVEVDFMQLCGPGVFLPEQIHFSASADGQTFVSLASWKNQVVRDDTLTIKRFSWTGDTTARYIRCQANAGALYGGVVFTDEIVVR